MKLSEMPKGSNPHCDARNVACGNTFQGDTSIKSRQGKVCNDARQNRAAFDARQNKASDASSKDVMQAYQELQGCSSDELMNRLASEVRMQKENGTFDFDGLKDSVEKMKGYLPDATYQNMIRIIETLR